MLIQVDRGSVCMGDNVSVHIERWTMPEDTWLETILGYANRHYLATVGGSHGWVMIESDIEAEEQLGRPIAKLVKQFSPTPPNTPAKAYTCYKPYICFVQWFVSSHTAIAQLAVPSLYFLYDTSAHKKEDVTSWQVFDAEKYFSDNLARIHLSNGLE